MDQQNTSVREWEDKYTHLEKEFERLRISTELECHRACAREREKWEEREERLVEQLKDLGVEQSGRDWESTACDRPTSNDRLEAGPAQMKQLYEQLLRDTQTEAVSGGSEAFSCERSRVRFPDRPPNVTLRSSFVSLLSRTVPRK